MEEEEEVTRGSPAGVVEVEGGGESGAERGEGPLEGRRALGWQRG